MAKKKLEKILDKVKKIPGVNKIPGLNTVFGILTAAEELIDQFNSKKDKIKKIKEKYKERRKIAGKIETLTESYPKNEEEKIKKEKELRKHFDDLRGA